MPLRKLWNVLRGAAPADDPIVASGEPKVDQSSPKDVAPSNEQSHSKQSDRESRTAAPKRKKKLAPRIAKGTVELSKGIDQAKSKIAPPPPAKVKPEAAKRSSGRHRPLIKTIASNFQAFENAAILEIGVGDATRAVDVLMHLQSGGHTLRYAAIDEFEAGGGEIKLMDFHRKLRSADIRPQVFPESVSAGLSQVGRTIGGIDLILVSSSHCGGIEQIEDQLSRIAHPQTVVLVGGDKNWTRHPLPRTDLLEPSVRQAA